MITWKSIREKPKHEKKLMAIDDQGHTLIGAILEDSNGEDRFYGTDLAENYKVAIYPDHLKYYAEIPTSKDAMVRAGWAADDSIQTPTLESLGYKEETTRHYVKVVDFYGKPRRDKIEILRGSDGYAVRSWTDDVLAGMTDDEVLACARWIAEDRRAAKNGKL